MTTQKQKLFEQIVDAGLFCELTQVPSGRTGAGNTRYEVINARGDLLGKGPTRADALSAAWKSFQRRACAAKN